VIHLLSVIRSAHATQSNAFVLFSTFGAFKKNTFEFADASHSFEKQSLLLIELKYSKQFYACHR